MNTSIIALPPTFAFARTFVQRYGLLILMLFVLAATASATSTGGTEFADIYDMLKGWASGTLGKTLAMGAFIIGMGIGIVKQSVMAIVLGLGFAVTMAYAPDIIEAVFTATL